MTRRHIHKSVENMVKQLIILAGFILIICANTVSADDCKGSGDLKYICGPINAEDILPLGDTPWLITSGLNGQFSNTDDTGHIYLVNREEKTFEEFFPGEKPNFNQDKKMFGACPSSINPENFSAHGLALKQLSSNRFRLYVTGHGAREAIEVFDINTQGSKPAISWTGCVLLPERILANSVAILADGGFVTTKFYDPSEPDSFDKVFQGKITGSIFEWHPGGEVKAIPGTGLSGANGIEISQDNKWVYAAATGAREIVRFDRTESPVKLKKVKISLLPDNIRWGDDKMLYTTGDNYIPPEECNNPPCETGWSVIRIDPETMETRSITGNYIPTKMPKASVAIPVGTEIWIGTYAGDRIGYLPRPE